MKARTLLLILYGACATIGFTFTQSKGWGVLVVATVPLFLFLVAQWYCEGNPSGKPRSWTTLPQGSFFIEERFDHQGISFLLIDGTIFKFWGLLAPNVEKGFLCMNTEGMTEYEIDEEIGGSSRVVLLFDTSRSQDFSPKPPSSPTSVGNSPAIA